MNVVLKSRAFERKKYPPTGNSQHGILVHSPSFICPVLDFQTLKEERLTHF